MAIIASFGEKLKSIYARWFSLIDALVRFLAAASVFFWIRGVIGNHERLMNPFVMLVCAMICAVMHSGMIAVLAGLFIMGNAFVVSLEAGAATLVILFIVYTLFLRFVPDSALGAALVPVTMYFGFPLLVPLVLGTKKKPSSMFSAASGILIYYLCSAIKANAEVLHRMEPGDYAGKVSLFLEGVFHAQCIVGMLSVSAVVLIVYAIRNLGFPHCFEAAILLGGLSYPALLIFGNLAASAGFDLIPALFGTAMSVMLAMLLQTLILPLNFREGKKLRFEDDDYYYFVTAVPKYTSPNSEDH